MIAELMRRQIRVSVFDTRRPRVNREFLQKSSYAT